MRMLRVALLGAIVCATVSACSAARPVPEPAPHYTLSPLVLPGDLLVESSGASVCSTRKGERDTVLGFGLVNRDPEPLTITGVSFRTLNGGHLAGAWRVRPSEAVQSAVGLITSQFDFPPRIASWGSRTQLTGTTLVPGASTYVLLHLVIDPGKRNALFLDPSIHYLKSGTAFTADTTASGYQHVTGGPCAFATD